MKKTQSPCLPWINVLTWLFNRRHATITAPDKLVPTFRPASCAAKPIFRIPLFAFLTISFIACQPKPVAITHKPALVFQSDFGLKDGAVSAMKGVAIGVDPDL